jgi:hypothetical protein
MVVLLHEVIQAPKNEKIVFKKFTRIPDVIEETVSREGYIVRRCIKLTEFFLYMSEKPAGSQFVLLATTGTPAKSRYGRNGMYVNNSIGNSRGQQQKEYRKQQQQACSGAGTQQLKGCHLASLTPATEGTQCR